jgi:hypothetical protein
VLRGPDRPDITVVKLIAAVAAALALVTASPSAAHADDRTVGNVALGIIGNYSDADMTSLHSGGKAADMLVEMTWAAAEPAPGQFNYAYLDQVKARITRFQQLGYTVSFNTGVQEAPAWLLAQPGARYVDQFGEAYTDSTEPNLVFGTQYRGLAERYLQTLFSRLGTGFSIVRAGGGHWGELTYPFKLDKNTGKLRNLYYAFDENAKRSNPVPGWKPGMASPSGQASRFLTWYLNSLAAYQNWQVSALRKAGYTGSIAVLYPSWGMRSGDFDKAVATNLAGTSSPEINGEVQRGYDATRQINSLTDPGVVVYGTWAESSNTVAYLSGLAKAKGLRAMAETSHVCAPEQLPTVMAQARRNDLAALYIVRLGASDIVKSSSYLTAG